MSRTPIIAPIATPIVAAVRIVMTLMPPHFTIELSCTGTTACLVRARGIYGRCGFAAGTQPVFTFIFVHRLLDGTPLRGAMLQLHPIVGLNQVGLKLLPVCCSFPPLVTVEPLSGYARLVISLLGRLKVKTLMGLKYAPSFASRTCTLFREHVVCVS